MAARAARQRPRRSQDIVDQLDTVMGRLRQQRLTPAQETRVIDILFENIERRLTEQILSPERRRQVADRLEAMSRSILDQEPGLVAIPHRRMLEDTESRATAPRRTGTYLYRVEVGGNTYSIRFRLPSPSLSAAEAKAIRTGRLDRRMLFDILERSSLPSPMPWRIPIPATIRMEGESASATEFNAPGNQQRAYQNLRDLYMREFRRSGDSIRVRYQVVLGGSEASAPARRRRPGPI